MRRQKVFKLTRYSGGMHEDKGPAFDTDLDMVRISGRDVEDGTPISVAVSDMLLEMALVKGLKPGDRVLVSVEVVNES